VAPGYPASPATGGTGRFQGVTGDFLAVITSETLPPTNPDRTVTLAITYDGRGPSHTEYMNDKFDEPTEGLAQSVMRREALKSDRTGLAGRALACFEVSFRPSAVVQRPRRDAVRSSLV
jgi:hypothetical protein